MPDSRSKQQHFMALYEPVHEPLLRYCEALSRNPDTAKELVSEVVLEAFENLHKLRKEEAFPGFLFGIARNKMHRRYRKAGRETGFIPALHERQDGAAGPEMKAEVSLLYDALNQLPDKTRDALILFEVSGFSLKEIQDIQGGSLSGVKVRLKRGREKLQNLLRIKETA